jgi:hypothetical protein
MTPICEEDEQQQVKRVATTCEENNYKQGE